MDDETISIRALVLDHDSPSTRLLVASLGAAPHVSHVVCTPTLAEAHSRLRDDHINTIFVDILSFGIDECSSFVFEIRVTLPWIVFVLFQDQERVEEHRDDFFRGERRRFSHYFRLDKRTPADAFDDELAASIRKCQTDLSWRMLVESAPPFIEPTLATPESALPVHQNQGPAKHVLEQAATHPHDFTHENTVFVSHRFSEADETLVQGLIRHLGDKGFTVVTGKLATGYISQAVIGRIKDAEYFLCLLTRADRKNDGTFTASAWLHQELGAALAFAKPVVLMVEEGVTDLGGLQGDVQRIHFADRGFMSAALDATDILQAYSGTKPAN